MTSPDTNSKPDAGDAVTASTVNEYADPEYRDILSTLLARVIQDICSLMCPTIGSIGNPSAEEELAENLERGGTFKTQITARALLISTAAGKFNQAVVAHNRIILGQDYPDGTMEEASDE